MPHYRLFSAFARCSLALAALCLCACSTTNIPSKWRDRPVLIDGTDGDWSSAKFIIEKTPVTMGLLNDDEHLYVYVATMDRPLQMQIIRRGFTVWFDPKGGKSKQYGIRFPLGDPLIGRRDREDFFGPMGRQRGDYRGRGTFGAQLGESLDRQRLQDLFDELLTNSELEIYAPGQDPYRLLPAQEADLDVDAVYADGRLVYELKIGLSRLDPPLREPLVKPGAQIGLGFETPEIDWDAVREQLGDPYERDPEGLGPGGFGGSRGAFDDGTGGYGRSRRGYGEDTTTRTDESFQLWTKVQLAKDS